MIFHIKPIETVAGKLRLLKIRTPDITRVERGDADFTINEYDKFKRAFLNKKGFKFIQRENFEMIELMDDKYDVRAYFSNPTQEQLLGVK
jgi:hypothetical protein